MNIELAYANDTIGLDIPDGVTVDLFSPSVTDNPVDFELFQDGFVKAGGGRYADVERLLIVINDGHRNTPTPRLLELIEQYDSRIVEKADFLIAAGTHGQPSEAHYQKIFGRYHDRLRPRCEFHDCHDYSRMKKIGTDWFNAEVWVNQKLFEYDDIIIISSVEPHYFAGYTGGRKSILPGLADFKTVERNHNQANSLEAAPLKVKGNPVAEHMAAVLDMLGAEKFLGVQGVIDAHKNLAEVFFGDLKSSFEGAMVFSELTYARPVAELYDAIICEVLPPLDNSLYQLQKALENCQSAVKEGGAIILLSACQGGIGSDHFFELACGWDSEKNVSKDGQLHFGSHKLSRVNAIGRRIDVRVHSTLPDETVKQVFYQPLADVQEFLAGLRNKGYRLAIVRDAGHTVLTTTT